MKVGDLVVFNPGIYQVGALTAVKFFERLRRRTGDKPGVILEHHGDNMLCAFGENVFVTRREYLEVVNEE